MINSTVKLHDAYLAVPCEVGDNCRIGPRVWIERYAKINCNTEIRDTSMDSFCSIGANNSIGAFPHPTNWLSTHEFQYPSMGFNWDEAIKTVKKLPRTREMQSTTGLGADIWTGHNVVIKAGIMVGTGAIIGANSVVTRDVPPYTIVAGAPAKVIRKRFHESIINRLLATEWWNKPIEQLKNLQFNDIEVCLKQLEELS